MSDLTVEEKIALLDAASGGDEWVVLEGVGSKQMLFISPYDPNESVQVQYCYDFRELTPFDQIKGLVYTRNSKGKIVEVNQRTWRYDDE